MPYILYISKKKAFLHCHKKKNSINATYTPCKALEREQSMIGRSNNLSIPPPSYLLLSKLLRVRHSCLAAYALPPLEYAAMKVSNL